MLTIPTSNPQSFKSLATMPTDKTSWRSPTRTASTARGNATNGTLTLSGSATLAQYEAALRSITYTNTSDNPSTATRTVSFTVNDAAPIATHKRATSLSHRRQRPPVEASIEGSALGYTENAGAVAITSTITVTDVDDTNIESAVVQITGNYANGQDVLTFSNQNGITGSWNATNAH